jgi:succinyl-diaminopimelate desuccinylase
MSLYQRACDRVEERQGDLVEVMRRIVAVDNGVPPGRDYARLVELLEPRFQSLGFAAERVVVPQDRLKHIPFALEGERVNLMARRATGREPVTVYAHMDTWPAGEGWTTDPFAGVVIGEHMYGNGISDVKGLIGCLLIALEVMDELHVASRFDLTCCLCTDKEIVYYPGLHYLAEKGYVQGHILQLAGSADPVENLGYMGMMAVEVMVHSSNDYDDPQPVNALEALLPILDELMQLKRLVAQRVSQLPPWPFSDRVPPEIRSQLSLDALRAEYPPRTVPGCARLVLHRTYLVEEDAATVEAELREAIQRGQQRSPVLSVAVNILYHCPALRLDEQSLHRQQMQESYMAAHDMPEARFVSQFSRGPSDLGVAGQCVGGDIVRVGIARWDCRAHHTDERVRVSDCMMATKQIIHYLGDWTTSDDTLKENS